MRWVLLAACLLPACDPLAGNDYVGEPMFTLSGTLSSKGSVSSDSSPQQLSLMWQDSGGAGGPGVAATAIPVTLEFPSTLRLAIPLPPPDAARFAFDDSPAELAEAYFVIVGDAEMPLQMRGLDRTHVLVWASSDVAEGTQAADYLGGPLSAGYHLRRFTTVATPGAAQQLMIDRCVESGASRPTCEVRRSYQLAATADTDRLRIVVTP